MYDSSTIIVFNKVCLLIHFIIHGDLNETCSIDDYEPLVKVLFDPITYLENNPAIYASLFILLFVLLRMGFYFDKTTNTEEEEDIDDIPTVQPKQA